MSTLDYLVIILYFGVIGAIAFFSFKKANNVGGYFLAGRDVGFFAVGASLFASNIGSEHLVGLAGTGASSGLAVAHFELLAVFVLIILGYVFAPFYFKTNVYTMPEYLEKRYSRASRFYLSIVSIIGYVLTKISVTLFAGGVVLSTVLNIDPLFGSLLLILFTGVYTIIGGLSSVIYTEVIQTFLMIFGSILVVIFGLNAVGGYENLVAKLPGDYLSMWKGIDHPQFPFTGILLGAPILGIWYWCTDQYIVQRVLAAKNVEEARSGTIFAAFLKILPLFIFVFPGLIAYVLFPDIIKNQPDKALPLLIINILPVGVKGLVIGGFLAALMSSLASTFNSCSTLLTMDIYKFIKKDADQKELLIFGKISTAFLVFLGILWIPMMKYISSTVYVYLQSVQAYIAPPIAAVFIMGLIYKKATPISSISTLIIGFILGMLRLILEINKEHIIIPFIKVFATINFLHFAFFLFVFSCLLIIIISYFTYKEEIQNTYINELTINKDTLIKEFSNTNIYNKIFTLLAILIVCIIWYIYR